VDKCQTDCVRAAFFSAPAVESYIDKDREEMLPTGRFVFMFNFLVIGPPKGGGKFSSHGEHPGEKMLRFSRLRRPIGGAPFGKRTWGTSSTKNISPTGIRDGNVPVFPDGVDA